MRVHQFSRNGTSARGLKEGFGAVLFKAGEILSDSLADSEIEGVGDNGVAYAHLVEQRERLLEELEVAEVEVMSGVEADSESAGLFGSLDERSHGPVAVGLIHVGVGFGVEFDAVGADFGCGPDLRGVRADKDRDADSGVTESGHDLAEEFLVFNDIPACRACKGVGSVGHESDLCGCGLYHQVYEVLRRISFDVELDGDSLGKLVDVTACDVTFVRTRVDGDALGSEVLAVERETEHVGHILASGVAQGGNFVDINA